jgi:uncharacterized membrane protein YjfL (UPF0719 family)
MLGISCRDDAVERRNPAASAISCGAIVGITLLYAGCNIGEGATIWTTLVPAVIGLIVWGLLLFMVEMGTKLHERVVIERDLAAGVRVGALLAANGLIIGRAFAGDWKSFGDTLQTFGLQSWPIFSLTAAILILQRRSKVCDRHLFSTAILPGIIIVSLAIAWVILLGRL